MSRTAGRKLTIEPAWRAIFRNQGRRAWGAVFVSHHYAPSRYHNFSVADGHSVGTIADQDRSDPFICSLMSEGSFASETSPIFSGNSRATCRMYLSCSMYRWQKEHMRKWTRSFARVSSGSSFSIPNERMRITSGHFGVNRQISSTICN
jgi:hypothetical protein